MGTELIRSRKAIVDPRTAATRFRLTMPAPAADLEPFVSSYWVVSWDLAPGEWHEQEIIPYPCVNLAVEPNQTGIYGIPTARFCRRLEGKGVVFGVRFLPGAFHAFLRSSVARLTDRVVPIADALGVSDRVWADAIRSAPDERAMAREADALLRQSKPALDESIRRVGQFVDRIASDRTILTVEELVRHAGMTKRALQRLFREYVGIGPKQVIRGYRLQEAAAMLAEGTIDLAELAVSLGYFDQSHVTRDFKAFVGKPPGSFASQVAQRAARFL